MRVCCRPGLNSVLLSTAADVLANDKRNTAQRGADGETVPILVHHWISAQGSYDKGITARRLYMRTYAGRQYRVTIGGIAKTGLFLVQSCSAKNPTSYAQRVIGNADFPCCARTNRGIAVFTGVSVLRPSRELSHVSHRPWQSVRQKLQSPDSQGVPRFMAPTFSLLLGILIRQPRK